LHASNKIYHTTTINHEAKKNFNTNNKRNQTVDTKAHVTNSTEKVDRTGIGIKQ